MNKIGCLIKKFSDVQLFKKGSFTLAKVFRETDRDSHRGLKCCLSLGYLRQLGTNRTYHV